ncbi:MAG: membrane protein insertase YidC [Burkholderiales bacterium]
MDSLRVFAAIIFAVSVFLLFDAWMREYRAPVEQPVAESPVPSAPVERLPTATPEPGVDGTAAAVPPTGQSATAADSTRLIKVSTDVFAAEIDPRGGVLRRLELLQHRDTLDKEKNLVLLLQEGDRTYLAQSGLIGNGLPNHTTPYRAEKFEYALQPGQNELRVALSARGESGAEVTKHYVFHRGTYLVDVRFEVRNPAGEPMRPHAYFQLMRDGNPPPGDSRMLPTYTGAAVYTNESKFTKVDFGDIEKGKGDYPRQANDGWVAIVQHYFLGAWLPKEGTPREYYTRALGNEQYAVGVIVPVGEIGPGERASISMPLYAGPQEQDKLAELAPGLQLAVDYGWLTVIAAPLFWVLSAVHDWVGNWGVAIIILTVIIKLLFYPLSAASYRSMAKMRVLAPKLQKLKEIHGDDRQKMQQAMIELYRTEKINPLGGCLPILVQIPVFIALYWVLLGSVEMRHAPFMLWITDLSTPDPYYILPVLMGLSMIVQTWLNPTPPDPVQAKVMKIMPVVFSVFFFFFPAGLVLYWLVNNLLSIAQQWQITRTIERSKAAHASR